MKSSSLIGIVIGIVAIFGAFLWEGGSFDSLFMAPAMTIVFVGTLAAGLAGSSWSQMKKLPLLFGVAFRTKKQDLEGIINQIVEFSYIARKKGLLAIEDELHKSKHHFLKKLFQACVDGADPETLKKIAETEVFHTTERHEENINLFVKLGGYSPTMGIIGTVMGLISALASVGGNPNELIRHIASAFIATMWGIIMANIVWLPIGDRLRTLHDKEIELMKVITDGVLAVQTGEMPIVIRSKLSSAMPPPQQQNIYRGGLGERLISQEKNESDKNIEDEL